MPVSEDDGASRGFLEPIPPKGRFHGLRAFAKWVLGVTVVALIVTGLALPVVVVPGAITKSLLGKWEALPTELPYNEALPQRVIMTDRNGKTIAVLYSENRIPLTLSQMSPYVKNALLATEDARFYEHNGIDLAGIARAFLHNSSGGSRQGGSTLTQQYVKNILQYAAKTKEEQAAAVDSSYMRKIKEARLALALEHDLSKDQILENYLNTVYFGDGAYGIGAAAQHYFSKRAVDLNLGEAATLVGILKSTTNYDPTNDIDAATTRRDTVLMRMVMDKKITQAQADLAKSESITLKVAKPRNGCAYSAYPLYCEWVKQTILTDESFGKTQDERDAFLARGGFKVKTALDPNIQAAAQAEARNALGETNRVAAGVAVVQPGTGEVLALATNKPWGANAKKGQTELLLPVLPAYQPGSNFKPIVLATALEQGFPITTRFDTPNNYIPTSMNHPADGFSNDDDRGHGVIDAYQATANSVNTWFIKLIEQTGVKATANMAKRLGIEHLPTSGPMKITDKDASLALGAYEVSPLEMATAYATFAAHGVKCNPIGIISMTAATGGTMPVPSADCHQAISPEVADTVADVLQAPFKGGTASGLNLNDARPAAGKTGTTDNSAATWFTGFTPQYATSVWIGDPRGGQRYPLKNIHAYGTTIGTVYGRSVAGPIWRATMNAASEGLPVEAFAEPGIVTSAKPIVPNVVGLSISAAAQLLKQEGFKVAINESTGPSVAFATPDHVYSQDPEGGAQFASGTTVTLTLTSGSNTDISIGS